MFEKGFGFGDVGGVVDIKDLGEGMGFQLQAVGDEAALEVAHAALTFGHAAAQGVECTGGEGVDTARDEAETRLALVIKAVDVQGIVRANVERALVVDEIGHGHQAVEPGFQPRTEGGDVVAEIFFAKDGVDRRQTEGGAFEHGGNARKTVHGRGRGRHFETKVPFGMRLAQMSHELLGFGAQTVDDDDDLLRGVGGKDAHKALDHGHAVERDEGFRCGDAFFGEARAFAGGNDGKFHAKMGLKRAMCSAGV